MYASDRALELRIAAPQVVLNCMHYLRGVGGQVVLGRS